MIDMHGDNVYRLCRSLTYSVEDAEDLFQDTFLKAFEQSVTDERLLFSTAIYLWKSRRRKYARRNRIAQQVPLEHNKPIAVCENPESDVIRADEIKMVKRLVDDLPDKLRVPVILYYTAELGVSDISKALKIPEGTVKSRLHKARGLIKNGVFEYENES
jgi:RNA polymerase sigma-70 factor (ECF subfamily)